MRLLIAAVALSPFPLSADTTVTPGRWDLYRGTEVVARGFPTEAACIRAADETNDAGTFTCRTEITVVVPAAAQPARPEAVPTPPSSAAPAASGFYDVSAAIAPAKALPEFATLDLPAPPRIRSEDIVSSAAQFQRSVGIPRRRTIIPAGTTITVDTLNITGTDLEIELRGNLECTDALGVFFTSVTRLRLIGAGGRLLCPITGSPSSDITFYGVEQFSRIEGAENNWWGVNRFAVLHSTFDNTRYALFLHPDSEAQRGPTDVIIANSSFHSGGGMSVHRVGRMQRAVYVDNWFKVRDGEAANTFRQHEDARSVYVERNLFVISGPRFFPEAGVVNSYDIVGVWFLRNRIYQPPGQGVSTSLQLADPGYAGYPRVRNVTVHDNEIWTETGSLTYQNESQPTWSFSNNRVNPQMAAPPWSRQAFAPLPADYAVLP